MTFATCYQYWELHTNFTILVQGVTKWQDCKIDKHHREISNGQNDWIKQ